VQKISIGILLAFSLLSADGDIPLNVEETVTAPVATEESSSWKHKLSVYGWLPSLNGKITFTIPDLPSVPGEPGEPGDGGTATSSFLDKLDMVFMGTYEVRKEKWSFLIDTIYLKMSDSQEDSVTLPPVLDQPPLQVYSEQELTMWFLDFYAGYNTIDTNNFTLDIIAGMRYFYFGVDAAFAINDRDISISPSIEFYDALIGIKGEVNLSENWYVPYKFDIGRGDSKLTWQTEASIGYRFNWGDILATYRYIHYDKDASSGLIHKVDVYGPKLGLVFHF